jgi:hypothetical protein
MAMVTVPAFAVSVLVSNISAPLGSATRATVTDDVAEVVVALVDVVATAAVAVDTGAAVEAGAAVVVS